MTTKKLKYGSEETRDRITSLRRMPTIAMNLNAGIKARRTAVALSQESGG